MNKRVTQVFIGLIYLVITYGILGPWLISQPSTLAFALGIVVTAVIPAYIAINFKKIFTK